VLRLVEGWIRQLESGATADALAEHGLGALVRANPAPYLEQARQWATHPHRWTRRFALALLLPLVRDADWDNVPAALAVLRPAMSDSDGEVRRAAAQALEGLGAKSPGEIARFLREQAARPNAHTRWIVRNALGSLEPETQAEIIRLLRS
jgi:HEAT repeat protein